MFAFPAFNVLLTASTSDCGPSNRLKTPKLCTPKRVYPFSNGRLEPSTSKEPTAAGHLESPNESRYLSGSLIGMQNCFEACRHSLTACT